MGSDFCLSLFDYTSNLKKQQQAVEELREMYPDLNSLIKQDEHKLKIINPSQIKVEKNIFGGVKSTISPVGKLNPHMYNIRTKFETESIGKNGSFFQRFFMCGGCK